MAVEQGNVVFDEQVIGLTLELLFLAVLFDLVVAGGHRLARAEGVIQVAVGLDALANQIGVGGPDDGAVTGIDIGQQRVRKMLDMIEELDPSRHGQLRAHLQMLLVQARIEQLTHGGARWQLRMAHFGLGHGLDELGGEHGVSLHAIADHEAGRYIAQTTCHRRDDQQADHGKPAQQIEFAKGRSQTTAGVGEELVGNIGFQRLHREVPAQGFRSEGCHSLPCVANR
ncbi:hypothetical protein D3C78_331890 [compost metagenome]